MLQGVFTKWAQGFPAEQLATTVAHFRHWLDVPLRRAHGLSTTGRASSARWTQSRVARVRSPRDNRLPVENGQVERMNRTFGGNPHLLPTGRKTMRPVVPYVFAAYNGCSHKSTAAPPPHDVRESPAIDLQYAVWRHMLIGAAPYKVCRPEATCNKRLPAETAQEGCLPGG